MKTLSAQQRRPERISAAPLVFSAALSAPAPGSSEWDLSTCVQRMRFILCSAVNFRGVLNWLGIAVTLFCIGAVQLPVQRSDDGGQVGAESLLPQIHGYRSQELKYTRSL